MKFLLLLVAGIVLVSGCTSVPVADTCKAQVAAVKDALTSLNTCQTKDDCEVRSIGCPFSCYSFVNKNADFSKADALIQSYKGSGCQQCEYGCLPPPETDCITGRCVPVG